MIGGGTAAVRSCAELPCRGREQHAGSVCTSQLSFYEHSNCHNSRGKVRRSLAPMNNTVTHLLPGHYSAGLD